MKPTIETGISLASILMIKGVFATRGEIRKYIQAGAIFIDGQRVHSIEQIISSKCTIQIGNTVTLIWDHDLNFK